MPYGMPQLTQHDMDAFIQDQEYHVFFGTHTVCVLRAINGQTCVGESVAHRVEDYNERIGREESYRDAVRNLWPMMTSSAKTEFLRQNPEGKQ